jgi:hypothetical protein
MHFRSVFLDLVSLLPNPGICHRHLAEYILSGRCPLSIEPIVFNISNLLFTASLSKLRC